jgi:UDP:flavonoid glycosyltransferase YjiC (YdhE family)
VRTDSGSPDDDAGVTRRPGAARHLAVLTSPLPGHLNPLQVLGAELVALGHRVTVVHIAGAARFLGDGAIGFAPLPQAVIGGGDLDGYLDTLARPSGPAAFARMIRRTAALTEALLDGAPAVLERIGADAVLADAVEPAGPLIARKLGLSCIEAVTGLPLMRERGVPPPFLGWPYRPDAWGLFRNGGGYAVSDRLMRPIARVLAARRRAWGLGRDADEPLLHVAQCPRGLDFPRAALPPRFLYGAPWRRAAADAAALPDDGRPLVFCSLGTLQGSRAGLFGIMAAACAAIGARAVIGHGGGLTPDEEARLPGQPLVRAFWPQTAVLRHCAAAVLHGGFNTVLDALAAGVPMVLLPIAFEQPGTAARVARIGAGRVLSSRGLRVATLARALAEVMDEPGFRAAAARSAAEIGEAGGAGQAAAAISAALSDST